jgi:hypothetical protein
MSRTYPGPLKNMIRYVNEHLHAQQLLLSNSVFFKNMNLKLYFIYNSIFCVFCLYLLIVYYICTLFKFYFNILMC